MNQRDNPIPLQDQVEGTRPSSPFVPPLECPVYDSQWHTGRWWRAMYFKDGRWRLWCESSDESEVRERSAELAEPVVIQNLHGREQSQWRTA